MLPIEVWHRILLYLNNLHDLINLLFVSKLTRNYILNKFDKYSFYVVVFVQSNFGKKLLRSNRINLLSKLYAELDFDI